MTVAGLLCLLPPPSLGQEPDPEADIPGCPSQIDSINTLFAAADPDFILVSIIDAPCTPAEKQWVYFQQGLGYSILGQPSEALLYFQTSLLFPGPKREAAWYELWKSARELDDKEQMAEAVYGLHREFPTSSLLFEILETEHARPIDKPSAADTAPARSPAHPGQWGTYHAVSAFYDPTYHRDYFENRLQWSGIYPLGHQVLTPSLQIGAFHEMQETRPWDWRGKPRLSNTQGQAGLAYMNHGFLANATLGFGYDFLRRTYSTVDGTELTSSLHGWNFPQFGLGLGGRFPLWENRGDLLAFVSGNRFHKTFYHTAGNLILSVKSGSWRHQWAGSGSKMFFDTPPAMPFEDSVFRLAAPLRESQIAATTGLHAVEGEYNLSFGRGRGHVEWAVHYRWENEILRQATEPLVFIAVADTSQKDSLYFNDTATTENSVTFSMDVLFHCTSYLSLKAGGRYGHLWLDSKSIAMRLEGPIYHAYMGITTRF